MMFFFEEAKNVMELFGDIGLIGDITSDVDDDNADDATDDDDDDDDDDNDEETETLGERIALFFDVAAKVDIVCSIFLSSSPNIVELSASNARMFVRGVGICP